MHVHSNAITSREIIEMWIVFYRQQQQRKKYHLQLFDLCFDFNGFSFKCVYWRTDLNWCISVYNKLISKWYGWLVLNNKYSKYITIVYIKTTHQPNVSLYQINIKKLWWMVIHQSFCSFINNMHFMLYFHWIFFILVLGDHWCNFFYLWLYKKWALITSTIGAHR